MRFTKAVEKPLFLLEIYSFFVSGYLVARKNYIASFVIMAIGLTLAFIVGGNIYKRGKSNA